MSSPSFLPIHRRSRGVSLVELLIGVAIGLIGTVAIFQAVAVWSKHTQTTTSGGDAQVAGTLALFNLERDIKVAGHGFGQAVTPAMGCVVNAFDNNGPRVFNFRMRPVDIATVGVGGAPDTINILFGNSPYFVDEGTFTNSTVTSKTLSRRNGFHPGDLAIVAGPGAGPGLAPCELIEVTNDNNADGQTIDHIPAVPYVNFYNGNNAPPQFDGAVVAPFVAGGTIYSLGNNPSLNQWSIVNGRVLAKSDLIHAGGSLAVAEGVVNIKAEYGVDADNNGRISDAEWTNVAPADFRTVLAVRVAVLVRSRQFERNGDTGASGVAAVTPTAKNPTYFANTLPVKTFLMTNVDGTPDAFGDLDADPNNWRYYRYRVFERVIPLRNILW